MTPSSPNSESAPLGLVILAAGASRRLGSCKALVRLGQGPQSTPLASLLRAGAALGAERSLILSGKHHLEIAEFVGTPAPGLELCRNAQWERGRSSSVRLAAQRLPGHDLCLAPVDVPLVSPAVFASLGASWRAADSPPLGWLAPAQRGPAGLAYGHPVLIGRGLLAMLSEATDALPLRHWRDLAQPLWSIEVQEHSILQDLDTPEDLERLRADPSS